MCFNVEARSYSSPEALSALIAVSFLPSCRARHLPEGNDSHIVGYCSLTFSVHGCFRQAGLEVMRDGGSSLSYSRFSLMDAQR